MSKYNVNANVNRRYKKHDDKKPPSRMRADAQTFTPFDACFRMDRLGTMVGLAAAKQAENEQIVAHNATGPLGYNVLKGIPGSSKQFWFLKRNNFV